jgi:hypothetical protein
MNLQKSYKLATCRFGYLWPQNVKREREREKLSRQFLYKMSAEKHQEIAVETSKESKNVVQRESYIGGRVLQLCAE